MLVTYFVNFRKLNDHLFWKELFIRFTTSAFRKLLSVYVFSYFPFGFEGRMWDLIVSVPDHCLSFFCRRVESKTVSQNSKIMFRTQITAKSISHSNRFSPYNFGIKQFRRNL